MKDELLKIRTPHNWDQIDDTAMLKKFRDNQPEVLKYTASISEKGYLHWEKARYKTPPESFTPAEAWYMACTIRKISSRPIPIKTEAGEPFTLLRLDNVEGQLRHIDMYLGGHFLLDSHPNISASEKQKYLTRGILEEAIASSQLEGASTTRRYAKKMIAENIRPRNHDDWMILNNYRVLQTIDDEYKDRDLSMEMLLEMHDMLMRNTIEDSSIGRLREDGDEIVVGYGDKTAHVPPSNTFIRKQLERLIDYANDDSGQFVHPVTKAIILHFWIGYLHPFVDGNGRMARSLFYWFMLKNDYWAVAFLPISMVIKRAPKKYAYAYIYTEQDGLDFTYFYDYNLRRINQAIDEFKEYVERERREQFDLEKRLDDIIITNDRQKRLIHYLISDDRNYTTVSSYSILEKVSRITADKDIKLLANGGLLKRKRVGKSIRYYATDSLMERL
jgi:Fic family protein